MPPEVHLLYRIALAILFFFIKYCSFKICHGFYWALLLARLPFLLCWFYQHQRMGDLFYFLVSSSVSFFKYLKFLSYKFYTCFGRVTPRYSCYCDYCILWFFFSPHLSSMYRKVTDFFELILYPAALLKVFMSCKSSLVDFLGSRMYTIKSSGNSESLTISFLICPFDCLFLSYCSG